MDSIPLPSGVVDWVFSEAVICQSSGKMAVFREIFRVLAPGGKFLIHDIAIRKLLPPEIADTVAAFAFGLAGAIELSSYRKLLSAMGVDECEVMESDSAINLERFWDSTIPQPRHLREPDSSAGSLLHCTDHHWLREYVTGIRLQARKPRLTAAFVYGNPSRMDNSP